MLFGLKCDLQQFNNTTDYRIITIKLTDNVIRLAVQCKLKHTISFYSFNIIF